MIQKRTCVEFLYLFDIAALPKIISQKKHTKKELRECDVKEVNWKNVLVICYEQ